MNPNPNRQSFALEAFRSKGNYESNSGWKSLQGFHNQDLSNPQDSLNESPVRRSPSPVYSAPSSTPKGSLLSNIAGEGVQSHRRLIDQTHTTHEARRSDRLQRSTTKIRVPWAQRIGTLMICVLVVGTLGIMAMMIFLSFLWFADHNCSGWRQLMVRNWCPRLVSLSSLAVRTITGVQAGVCTSMLASLALEQFLVPLSSTALVSITRSVQPGAYTLILPFLGPIFSRKTKFRIWNVIVPLAAFCLVITTLLLQFSTTVLLSDLEINSVSGFNVSTRVAYDFTYAIDSEVPPVVTIGIPSWNIKPFNYPTFAEHSEAPFVDPRIKDTGRTLRAFLPFASAQERENIQNYTGEAIVLDSRVTCQQPILSNETVSYDESNFETLIVKGSLLASVNTPRLMNATSPIVNGKYGPANFTCSVNTLSGFLSTEWPITLCQLYSGSEALSWAGQGQTVLFSGGLVSEFSTNPPNSFFVPDVFDSTVYYTPQADVAYLMVNVSLGTSYQWRDALGGRGAISPPFYDTHDEWTDLIYSKGGLKLSLSICYAAFDTADLSVVIFSPSNRTEPSLTYDRASRTFDYSSAMNQLSPVYPRLPMNERGILTLQNKSSWLPSPNNTRPEGLFSFASSRAGINSEDFTVSMTNSACGVNHFTCGLFQQILTTPGTGGVAFALQATITMLTSLIYYDVLAMADKSTQNYQVNFIPSLTPSSYRGLVAFFIVIFVYLLLVGIITGLFLMYSKYSIIGNAWQAVAQLQSERIREIVEMASMASDGEIEKWCKENELKRRRVGLCAGDNDGKVIIRDEM